MNLAEGWRRRWRRAAAPHNETGQIETRRSLFDVGARVSSDTVVQFFKVFHKKPTGCENLIQQVPYVRCWSLLF